MSPLRETTAAPARPVMLLDWTPTERNTLRGFATVRFGQSLVTHDITVHCGNGKRWIGMPSKPIVDRAGTVKRNESGKIQYTPVLSWNNHQAKDRFAEAVIAAVEAEHGALG